MDPLATARTLAAAHPDALLPCPVCVTSLRAANLDRHVAKVHAGVAIPATTRWSGRGLLGLLPGSLALDGDALVLRRLGRRRVALPCAIELGALVGVRGDVVTSSYADELNHPGEEVRTGSYLRLVGDAAITIGCRQGTQARAHWDAAGWRRGERRRGCDLMVARPVLVAIEYALAARGLLVPAAAR